MPMGPIETMGGPRGHGNMQQHMLDPRVIAMMQQIRQTGMGPRQPGSAPSGLGGGGGAAAEAAGNFGGAWAPGLTSGPYGNAQFDPNNPSSAGMPGGMPFNMPSGQVTPPPAGAAPGGGAPPATTAQPNQAAGGDQRQAMMQQLMQNPQFMRMLMPMIMQMFQGGAGGLGGLGGMRRPMPIPQGVQTQ